MLWLSWALLKSPACSGVFQSGSLPLALPQLQGRFSAVLRENLLWVLAAKLTEAWVSLMTGSPWGFFALKDVLVPSLQQLTGSGQRRPGPCRGLGTGTLWLYPPVCPFALGNGFAL